MPEVHSISITGGLDCCLGETGDPPTAPLLLLAPSPLPPLPPAAPPISVAVLMLTVRHNFKSSTLSSSSSSCRTQFMDAEKPPPAAELVWLLLHKVVNMLDDDEQGDVAPCSSLHCAHKVLAISLMCKFRFALTSITGQSRSFLLNKNTYHFYNQYSPIVLPRK